MTGELVPVSGTTNVLNEHEITLDATFTEGDMIVLEIEREGSNGSDDLVGNLSIMAVEVVFEGTGPTDSTDLYNIPARAI